MDKNIVKTDFFKGISLEEATDLLKNKEYFTKKFYKNNYLAYRNEEAKYIMIILSGKIQTMISNDSAKIKRMAILAKYTSIAPAFLFGSNNKFPVDVKALEESMILYISKKSVLEIIKENDIILGNYLDIISDKTQVLSQKLWKDFLNNTIKKKIHDYLLENLDKKTMIVSFDKSLEELAKCFDVSRPSLSRALSEFIKSGLLEKIERGRYLFKRK